MLALSLTTIASKPQAGARSYSGCGCPLEKPGRRAFDLDAQPERQWQER
jgi:hypothetical protein